MDFSVPKVMGIVNVTPDSFYSGSRTPGYDSVRTRVERIRAEGVDIVDIGGYSSRPGCEDISAEEEYSRLSEGLRAIRDVWPEAVVSVDTFRASVAERCVADWEVDIINDIGGGTLDPGMWETVARLGVAYVLMHMKGTPQNMTRMCEYDDVVKEVLEDLARKTDTLRLMGVADVIVDPGFGFAKNVEQNFQLLSHLDLFGYLNAPVLAGLSRKTMIWKTLGITAAECGAGTQALDTVALLKGADILRVHDVKQAVQAVRLVEAMKEADRSSGRNSSPGNSLKF